ncbi:MAG TPA: MBL fold metallo-hydrolase [Acidimicrobiia bacterium]|jgi:glyoxylase-like metal-dependent hydrolase (beta-lactamase superfamily II)
MQEAPPATEPLPPVERVRPGIWSIPVPLPIVLRYVLVYAFETDDGVYIIDAGWNTDDAYDALDRGLLRAGYAMTDVKGVMVTHIHADHYGLAGRIREKSGAWVALHPADAALLQDRYQEPEDLLEQMGKFLRRLGAPASEIEELRNASMPVRQFVEVAHPDVLLRDGQHPEVAGWDLTAVWTPGHSPGHLCFWEPTNKVMFTGDCVLPRITPNVSLNPQTGDDPLGDYLRSLDRIAAYDGEGFPAHEWRFGSLRDRTRELKDHHEHRFAEVVAAIEGGCSTAWEITPRMTWSRPWDETTQFARRSAISEALAHLRTLEVRGVVRELFGEPSRWVLTAGRSART